jgi:hydroxyacylglutathione hydrolase
MALFDIHQFGYMDDNYGVLLHDPASGRTAAIDAGDAAAYQAALAETGWTLDEVWITHHHGDHTAGLADLLAACPAEVTGPAEGSKTALAQLDRPVRHGDSFDFAGHQVSVIATPGHTLDMTNYWIAEAGLAFTGDTLFALGCGRVFEGDMEMMQDSLARLAALPAQTQIYCSHEYTAANARFALSVDPDNAALIARAEQVDKLRAAGQPTVPSLLAEELATNPFLRWGDAGLRARLGLETASDAEVFAEIRRRKDNF